MRSSRFSDEAAGMADPKGLQPLGACEAALRERVAELQRENLRLQGLVSELLLRNQQLRTGEFGRA
jgi:hypothetical protein